MVIKTRSGPVPLVVRTRIWCNDTRRARAATRIAHTSTRFRSHVEGAGLPFTVSPLSAFYLSALWRDRANEKQPPARRENPKAATAAVNRRRKRWEGATGVSKDVFFLSTSPSFPVRSPRSTGGAEGGGERGFSSVRNGKERRKE